MPGTSERGRRLKKQPQLATGLASMHETQAKRGNGMGLDCDNLPQEVACPVPRFAL